jgi:hypothetical protein
MKMLRYVFHLSGSHPPATPLTLPPIQNPPAELSFPNPDALLEALRLQWKRQQGKITFKGYYDSPDTIAEGVKKAPRNARYRAVADELAGLVWEATKQRWTCVTCSWSF